MRWLIRSLFVPLVLVGVAQAWGQVTLTLNVPAQMPSQLSVWESEPTLIQALIQNTSENTYERVQLTFVIRSYGVEVARTMDGAGTMPRFTVPPGMMTLNGPDFVRMEAIDVDADFQQVMVTTNSLPEGEYEFCARLLAEDGTELTSTGEICREFNVRIPDPPSLQFPLDGDTLRGLQFPNFQWTAVPLSPLVEARYKFTIVPIHQGQTGRDAIDRNSPAVEKTLEFNSYFYLMEDPLFSSFADAVGFAWQVQALNDQGEPATANEGKSEIWTFSIGQEIHAEPHFPTELYYPAGTVPDSLPPFVATLGVDTEAPLDLTILIQELDQPEGNPAGQEWNFGASNITFRTEGPVLLMNSYGPAGNRGIIPPMSDQWSPNPGISYRWTLALWPAVGGGDTVRSTASFTAGAVATNLAPAGRSEINSTETPLAFEVHRNTFDPTHVWGFGPAPPHSLKLHAVVRDSNPVIVNPIFETDYPLSFNDGVEFGYPTQIARFTDTLYRLPASTYRWFVETRYGPRTIATSDPAEFVVHGANPCPGCVCVDGVYPRPNATNIPATLSSFSIGFRPFIRQGAVRGGAIRVWRRLSAEEGAEETLARNPDFIGTFTTMEPAGEAADLIVFSVIPRDVNGARLTVRPEQPYMWDISVEHDPDTILALGPPCGRTHTEGGPFFFSTLSAVDCADDCSSPLPEDVTPSTRAFTVGEELQIGRFRLTLTSASGTGAALTGQGTIPVPFLRAPVNVEFSNLHVNNEGQVVSGDVTARQEGGSPLAPGQANQLGQDLGLTTDQINGIATFIADGNRLVSGLSGQMPVGMPLGFDTPIGNDRAVLAIIGLIFSPTRATMNAVMSFPLTELGPGLGLGLGARDICFHPNGYGGDGRLTLYLPVDEGFRLNDTSTFGFVFKAPTQSDSGTYVSWDCHGFRELRLSMETLFPRSWFTPVPDDHVSRVKAAFKAVLTVETYYNDWISFVDMDRCSLTELPGFVMETQEAYFDHSDLRNPAGMVFPEGFVGDRDTWWRGFFLKRASISITDAFGSSDDNRPLTFSVVNFMIGNGGFTGSCRVENLIEFPRGRVGSWGGSVDTVALDFVSNVPTQFALKGRIKIPVSDSALAYSAMFYSPPHGGDTRWELTLQPKDTINAPLWGIAKFSLYPTSRISIGNLGGTYQDTARLSGSLTIDGSMGSIPLINLRGVEFENFTITNTPPYVDAGNWSLTSPQHGIAGFPLNINDVHVVTGERNGQPGAGIQFSVALNLQPGGDAISGATTLSIWGRLDSDQGPQHFVYDGVSLDSVGLEADLGALQVAGGIRLYQSDNTFGDGFRGGLRATFLHQITVQATMQFGNVDGYRYWYVDAKAGFTPGIPVFTGVGIYGFGGGAWYHMRKEGPDPEVSADPSSSRIDTSHTPGGSNSGYTYLPDESRSLGLRAMVILGTHPSPDAFNADVALEVEFLQGGGVGRVGVTGQGYMLAGIASRDDAKVTADVNIDYDFTEDIFHGVFDVAIDARPFTGNGRMVAHFSPDLWYVKIGEPDSRVRLSLADWFSIDAYLMAGQELPPPPPLPTRVSQILGDLPATRDAVVSSGDGFAFGASANLSTGRQEFLIFYGYVSAGLGFDIALLNFGPGTTCEGGGGQIGVNNWYAMGQLYAFIEASIGLHVDVWFTEGDFEILGISAAAALQAGAPNPTWLKGAVGGSYRILGGLVHGHCNFEFQLGDECRPLRESPLARLDLISDVTPDSASRNVDVGVEPQAACNFDIDEPFEIRETSDDGTARVRTFRVKVRDATLERADNHHQVPGRWDITAGRSAATFYPHDLLAGNTRHIFRVSAYGEEFVNGAWRQAVRRDGSRIEQEASTSFRTGPAPDDIPASNVAYCYPLDRQRFFLQGECRDGIVALKHGQRDLFDTSAHAPGSRVRFLARLIPIDGGAEVISPASYSEAARTVNFTIPNISVSTAYALQIVRKEERPIVVAMAGSHDLAARGNGGAGIREVTMRDLYRRSIDGVDISASLRERKLPGTQVRQNEKLLFVYYFKTSRFSTLSGKISALTAATPEMFSIGDFQVLRMKFNGDEFFDTYDIAGKSFTLDGVRGQVGPLVRLDAVARTATWHTSFTNPRIYDPVERFRTGGVTWRETIGGLHYAATVSWHGSLLFEDYRDSHTLAQFPEDPGASSLLADWELTPSSGQDNGLMAGGLVAAPGGLLPGAWQPPVEEIPEPILSIDYNHGVCAPWDFTLLQNRAAQVLSEGVTVRQINLRPSGETRTWLEGIVARSYERISRGTYRLGFSYGYTGCIAPDASPRVYYKRITY